MPGVTGIRGPAAYPGVTPSPSSPAPAGPDTFAGTGAGPAARPLAGGGIGALGALGWTTPTALPATADLGVATIDRYQDPRVTPSKIVVTVFVPMPTPEFPGQILDMNAKPFSEIIPKRAIIGDAGHTRAFIGVDQRAGTPLDKALEGIVAKIPSGPNGERDLDDVVEWLRVNVAKLMKWAPGSTFNDGRPGLEWDKKIKVPDTIWGPYGSVVDEPLDHAPVSTGVAFPIVPFERYLEVGQGYCIHKALLAALVLERLGFSCRLVHGAVANGPGWTGGHSWVELPDGRVLDVAWSKCEKPGTELDPMFPNRFEFGGGWRFLSKRYPYVGWAA